MVGAEAVAACERAETSAQQVPGDTNPRRRPAQSGQPVRGGGCENGLPGRARTDPGRAASHIDLDAGERPHSDRDPATHLMQPAVPGTENGERLIALASDGHGGRHVSGRLRRYHDVGHAGDSEVEPGRFTGVPRIIRDEDARHPRASQRLRRARRHR